MKKQMQLFLVPGDEFEISATLKKVRPSIVFVNDNVWDGPQPATAESIVDCSSRLVYLWDSSICQTLPVFQRKDGRLEGPVSGVVVQFVRSQMQARLLLSGRLAAGTSGLDAGVEKAMQSFVTDIWKVVKNTTLDILRAVDPGTGEVVRERVSEYRVGHHAIDWASKDESRLFKDFSTANYFRCKEPPRLPPS